MDEYTMWYENCSYILSIIRNLKMSTKLSTIVLGLIISFVLLIGQYENHSDSLVRENEKILGKEIKAGLFKIYEDEKMARDTYLEFSRLWKLKVFENLAKSEKRHMHAIDHIFDHYEIDSSPLKSRKSGIFLNNEITKIYTKLLHSGSESSTEALRQSALLEELDIYDLCTELEKECTEEIEMVYRNLLAGSENHLRACIRILNRRSIEYDPQILNEEYYEEILAGSFTGYQRTTSCYKCEK